MEIIIHPLTIAEIKEKVDEENFIQGIVPVSLNRIINTDIEGFLDDLSEKLTGSSLLSSITYNIAGYQQNIDGYRDENAILIRVIGDVSAILEEES